jgi:dipeptidyl-peptidase 4
MSTIQDYQAAEQLLRRPARLGEWVIGDKVRPQWIDGGARFWYAMSDGAGKRFVLVDPAAGIREPAFDHARLAAALASTSGQQVGPEALPFLAIELAGNAVGFDAFGEHWRCRLDSYTCERAEFTSLGNPLEVLSPDKRVEVPPGHDLWARSLSDDREWALSTDGEPDYQCSSGPDCTSNGTLLRKRSSTHAACQAYAQSRTIPRKSCTSSAAPAHTRNIFAQTCANPCGMANPQWGKISRDWRLPPHCAKKTRVLD